MEITKNERNFTVLTHDTYLPENQEYNRLVQHSSAIDVENPDGFSKPGSSYLWIGKYHHLNKKEVKQLIKHLNNWVKTGSLELNKK